MTPEEIAECFRHVLDTEIECTEEIMRAGVIMVAHQIAAAYAESGDKFSPGCFLQACGL